jgi:hypothetical protein
MSLAPRVVVVHRESELHQLMARHGSRQQAGFFLSSRGRDFGEIDVRNTALVHALAHIASEIPSDWRRASVERADLDRFVFGPEDIVVAVGQDGLVANVAKYLDGQVVIGINVEPQRNPGVLVPLATAMAPELGRLDQRVMVEVTLDDGQRLQALNELYIGHPTHQSARYRLTTPDGRTERQSSSGILVGTGTGATGWCRSVWLERHSEIAMPTPQQACLCWFVREAWPSPATGIEYTQGLVELGQTVNVVAESDLVAFGDGIESDCLKLSWGQTARISVAQQRVRLLA